MKIDLTGRVALVTGGSRGIGAACCRLFAQAGCDVAINYRRRADLALAVAGDVERAGRRALTVGADVADPARVDLMLQRVAQELGRLDFLVNNAGIWTEGSIDTMTDADFWRMIQVNLAGTFHTCRAAVPLLRRVEGAAIVNVASTAGQRGEAHHGHYAASKGAVLSLTKSLAVELGPRGIRVNAVAPGWIRTDMTEEALRPERIAESLKEPIPLGRPGEPEDVAAPVVFLCSPLARHITGATLNVNGGAVLI
ncbi:MAG: SDR family NAD(P)-dependent oxidoreductase [Candidatus Eisenbacteria bacterium]